MADGEGEAPVANEHEQMLEAQQRLENEQNGQGEESERNEQNGGSDVPVPGVEPAAPSAPAPHSATLIQEYVKLFAGSIPKTFAEADIKPLFDEYGQVLEVVLIKNKITGTSQGCAFIKYKTVEEAEKAIAGLHNAKQLPGGNGPIQVRYADGERERLGNVEHKLFVGNMNKTATEDEITEVFKPYGNIEDLYVMRGPDKVSRGCCFVKYSSRDAALNAIKTLNGAQTVLNGEYPLAVRFADTKRRGEREEGRPTREAPYAGGRGPGGRGPPPQYGAPPYAPARGAPPYGGRGYAPQAPYQQPQYAPPQQPAYYQPPVQQPQYAPPPQAYQPPPVAYAPAPPAAPPPAHTSEWTEHTSPEGYKYYYNGKTGQSSWEKPEGFDGPPPVKEPVRSPPQYAAPPPASEWSEHTSPEGLKYYYNSRTGQSAWEKPAEMRAAEAAHEQPQYAAPQYSAPAQQYAPAPQAAAYAPVAQGGAFPPGAQAPASGGGKGAQYQHQNGPPGANLFIFRIPDDFDDDKLLQTFVPFGKVIHAKVGMDRDTGKSKGFGFVSYDNVESADAAIQSLNGITLGGKRLKVEKKRGEDGSSGTTYKPY